MDVDVSVLVAVRNEARFIRGTLAAILAQRFDGSVEFLLIDGCSEDGTREILEEVAADDDRVRVLENPKRHLRSGMNLGLREARGEFVAHMEGHSHYPPDYLARGVARLRRGDVDFVSGTPVPVGVDTGSRRVAMALTSWFGTGGSRKWTPGDGATAPERELDTGVYGGLWRRDTLERYDGWDEDWRVNGDAELAARMLADGRRIVAVPGLTASYIPRSDLRGLARQYWRYGYYRAKTAARYPDSLRRSHVLLPALSACAAAAMIPSPLRRPARAGVAAYAAAIALATLRAPARGLDLLALPVVFATMHLAWGFGFLAGCVRFGFPLAAVVRLIGR